jgi:hypothetical protein
LVNLVFGCLGGQAASTKDQVLNVVIGIMGFDMGIIYGTCDTLL